jgi:hypothetical protein
MQSINRSLEHSVPASKHKKSILTISMQSETEDGIRTCFPLCLPPDFQVHLLNNTTAHSWSHARPNEIFSLHTMLSTPGAPCNREQVRNRCHRTKSQRCELLQNVFVKREGACSYLRNDNFSSSRPSAPFPKVSTPKF